MRGLYFFVSVLTHVSSCTVEVTGFIGQNVTLPCKYDTQTYGVLSFCWGRAKVPRNKCSNTVLSSYDGVVDFRQSSRYQLLGQVMEGDVSLTILDAQWSDAGVYGCRVEIPGLFNDYKVNIPLVLEEAPEEQPVTDRITTDEKQDVEVGHLTLERVITTNNEGAFKAFLRVGNIGRVATIFFVTIIIIFVFIFRREFQLMRMIGHPTATTAENIYESVPCSR